MARNVSRCSKRWCCVRESSTSTDGLRADGFIAFADKDPSKDLPFDVFGSDPSNISFSRASSNILFEKTFKAGYKKDATYKGLVNGNTTTRRTIAARYFPALGNTTLISGPSYAYLCLPPHSPKLGAFLLSRTMLMMPNATICNMLYKHLPLPHYHLVLQC
jgi:hypothetical protein